MPERKKNRKRDDATCKTAGFVVSATRACSVVLCPASGGRFQCCNGNHTGL